MLPGEIKKRQLKSQGTSKIGSQCTAHIKATVKLDTAQVKVQYCNYHHNHEKKLAHLHMPQRTRMDIASKLQKGVSMNRILDDIRDSVSDGLNRQHLTTRKDLHNIKQQYNIEGIIRHANDLSSVTAWVEEMRAMQYNPILVFKKKGQKQPPEMDNVSDDDFILCIQTEFQRDMFKKFGSSVICIDSTHGTNLYDFTLTALLVVDEYGEGIPVGWMLSNREDVLMLMVFFQALKERVGPIHPQWIMSDMAEQYFTAWKATFDNSDESDTKKLVCAWHVDKAWRNTLRERITNKVKQTEVYHQLRMLLLEPDVSEFRVLLQHFLTHTKIHFPSFFTYFKDNYCTILHQWAACYRPHAPVNTNMFVEASHRVLKVVYFNNKQNRRVDLLLSI